MTRDKEKTKQRIVSALGDLIAREGFAALNVEALAQEADANKALIYRYFTSLDGVIEAYARSPDFWPSTDEVLGDADVFRALPASQKISVGLINFANALKARPQTIEILAMEFVQRSPVSEVLNLSREATLSAIFEAAELRPKPGLRAEISVLAAGLTYFLMRRRNMRVYNDIEIASESGWTTLTAAVNRIAERAFGERES